MTVKTNPDGTLAVTLNDEDVVTALCHYIRHHTNAKPGIEPIGDEYVGSDFVWESDVEGRLRTVSIVVRRVGAE